MKLKILIYFILFITIFTLAFANSKVQKSKTILLEKLGHHLFFDVRLSKNGMKSCATCHAPEYAFTDGYRRTMNIEAELLTHNTPSILNLQNYKTLNWASPNTTSISNQMLVPLFSKHPVELGMDSNDNKFLQNIEQDSIYKILLNENKSKNLTWNLVIKSISTYVANLNARNSKYDQYLKGKTNLTYNEEQGKKLFYSKKLNCSSCHGGVDFNESDNIDDNNFANIGLYNIELNNDYAEKDNGLFEFTQNIKDKGKFRIPTLRNILITAPYFHDGSITSLEEVIAIFSNGGQKINDGINKGNGITHPNKDIRIKSFKITENEMKQLISFFKTLTDTSYLSNSYFTSASKIY